MAVCLFFFAFSTILSWNLFGKINMVYLFGKKPSKSTLLGIRIFAIAVVMVGAVASLGVVWDTADVLMGLMAVINVPVIFLLVKPAAACLDDYVKQKKAGKNPVFKASDIGLKEETDFWN